MAYRRRQQVGRPDGLQIYHHHDLASPPADTTSPASSLATKAIRASSAYRDSSLSSVYEQSALSSPRLSTSNSSTQDSTVYEHITKKDINESKQGFWNVLARKAKAIIDDDDNTAQSHEIPQVPGAVASDRGKKDQYYSTKSFPESRRKTDNPSLQKGLDKIASSLNYIGGTIGNALEEGITAVEKGTADIIQETRKIQIRKKAGVSVSQNQASNLGNLKQPMQTRAQPQNQTDLDIQLKASRDVAMAMAAKAKLLLRELKTVKADLAFAKERCAQLEEENKLLRESREKGDNPEDDDLIRLQLESLLAEKARLAQENSVYARENRFLREIVEYHQLTMQDVVYFDEGSEEVSEVYPMKITTGMPSLPPTPLTPTIPQGAISQVFENTAPVSPQSLDIREAPQTLKSVNPYVQMPAEDIRRN